MSEETDVLVVLAEIKAEVATLTKKVDDMKDMVNAWQAFKTGSSFFIGLAKFGAAIVALALLLKGGVAALVAWGAPGGH